MRAGNGIGEDARFARDAWIRALGLTAAIERQPRVTMPVLVGRWAERDGAAVALASRDAVWNYRDFASACNRYARWGLERGLRPGDAVALVMENRVDYPAIWLGLARIGVAVALVNTNLRLDALAHALGAVSPKLILCGAGAAAAVAAVRGRMPDSLGLLALGGNAPGFSSIESGLAAVGDEPVDPSECALPTIDDVALYIYTSGTTGLPKAARVSHYRVMQWSHWFAGMMDTGSADRMYVCLPMYHSVGGVVAPGAALVGGGSVVIRPQFSAGDFWRDIEAERCTLFQYIGELCRYLLNAPVRPEETRHALRMVCGNGLRPEIWESFKRRFRIPRILEYYAATEGNFSLYNCEGEPGSIGRIPPLLSHRLPVALLRFDVDAERPLRNAAGYCERAADDEIGEAVGSVAGAGGRTGRFEGYVDAGATEGKLLRDVFEPGDVWYRTGDLMRRDRRGFYYFVDRVGETFRWKGENVSTTEVGAAVAAAPGVVDAVVYGVAVAGADGRAGMAALVIDADFDPATLRAHIVSRLPAYARPCFLRLLSSIDSTATFKPKKQDLIAAGFDPGRIEDPLYFDDRVAGSYRRLDAAAHAAIMAGEMRL